MVYVPLVEKKPMSSALVGVFWKDGKFNQLAMLAVILRGLNSFILPICFALLTYFCLEIGMVPAVAQSFTTFSSFTTAITFYFLYKERLTLQHMIGMIMIISSVIIVGIAKSIAHSSSSSRKDDDDLYLASVDYDDTVPVTPLPAFSIWYMMIPYFIAFIACFFLTGSSYLARMSKAAGYPSIQFCLDFSFASGILYIICFFYTHFGADPYPW